MSIIQNAIRIIERNTFILSRHAHDFCSHSFKDGTYISVDGGCEYIRRVGDFSKSGIEYEEFNIHQKDIATDYNKLIVFNKKTKLVLAKDLPLGDLKLLIIRFQLLKKKYPKAYTGIIECLLLILADRENNHSKTSTKAD